MVKSTTYSLLKIKKVLDKVLWNKRNKTLQDVLLLGNILLWGGNRASVLIILL